MYTVLASPSHILPAEIQAPTLKDSMGQGDFELRRQWTRTLKRWELTFDGQQEKLEGLGALLDYAQGDTYFWFDGGGTLDITHPVLIAVGDGVQTQFNFLHKNVFVASAIVYLNGAAVNTWTPVGGDGIICDKFSLSSAPGMYAQIKAKYRRKAKTVLNTDEAGSRQRVFRNKDNPGQTIYRHVYSLMEVPK